MFFNGDKILQNATKFKVHKVSEKEVLQSSNFDVILDQELIIYYSS